MDQRDAITWVAIELTKMGELKVEDGSLKGALLRDLEADPSFPVFIPSATYKKGGRTITVHLMEGYCFVASGLPEVRYFKLEKQPYIESVMSTLSGPHRMRTISVIPNRDIERLKRQFQEQLASDIVEGAWVKVVQGKFKGLEGRVLTLIDDRYAWVQFKLRSLHRISPLPRVFLESTEPAEL